VAQPYTGPDALAVLLSGQADGAEVYDPDASWGGVRLAAEAKPWAFRVESANPGVVVQCVSGANLEGVGYVRLTADGKLAYTAPGDTEEGESVEVAQGQTVVLPSASNPAAFVRVTRDGTLKNLTPLGMALKLVPAYANPVGHANVASADWNAGLTTYRCVFLMNRSASTLTGVRVWLDAGSRLAVGYEVPSADDAVQAVANERTAPTGIAFSTDLAIPDLAPGQSVGLWIRRAVPAQATASPGLTEVLRCAFTVDGVEHEQAWRGAYAVANPNLDRFELYSALNAKPNLSGSPASTASTIAGLALAMTAPLSGTRTYRYTILKRNAYGLVSENVYDRSIAIDSTGALVVAPVSAPTGVTLTVGAGGYADLSATYAASNDAEPADEFLIYHRSDGSLPNPATDTPIVVKMTSAAGGSVPKPGEGPVASWNAGTRSLSRSLGPFEWGAQVYAYVRTRRSSDGGTSVNSALAGVTVTTIPPVYVSHREALLGKAFGQDQPAFLRNTTEYPGGVKVVRLPGESQFWIGSELVWRCVWSTEEASAIHLQGEWAIEADDAGNFGAAGASPVEVVGNAVYLAVGGTRRLRFDTSTKLVTSAAFTLWGATTDCPSPSPVVSQATKALFQVWDPALGRYRCYAELFSTGVLVTACPLQQAGA
jgi:hypothetical protein